MTARTMGISILPVSLFVAGSLTVPSASGKRGCPGCGAARGREDIFVQSARIERASGAPLIRDRHIGTVPGLQLITRAKGARAALRPGHWSRLRGDSDLDSPCHPWQ